MAVEPEWENRLITESVGTYFHHPDALVGVNVNHESVSIKPRRTADLGLISDTFPEQFARCYLNGVCDGERCEDRLPLA